MYSFTCYRLSNIERASKGTDLEEESNKVMIKSSGIRSNKVMIKSSEIRGGLFQQLHPDILRMIVSFLTLDDYLSFRAVNKLCRSVAPLLVGGERTTTKKLEQNSLRPWLMLLRRCEDICRFVNPLNGERYLINFPEDLFYERASVCYSKGGWSVMVITAQQGHSIVLWNPFSKEKISLPNLPFRYESKTVSGCCFSSSPNSSDCTVVIMFTGEIRFITLRDRIWTNVPARRLDDLKAPYWSDLVNVNSVFFEEDYYFLGQSGKLAIMEESENRFAFRVLDELLQPCESCGQCFLLECNGNLVSVFVGCMGKWVKVFMLSRSSMAWHRVKNLGNYSLYVSQTSSFSTAATAPGQKNKIFFPKMCGNNCICYSLDSGMFHCYGSDDIVDELYNTWEKLHYNWIVPGLV